MTTNRKRVLRLMKINPHCYWCEIELVDSYPRPDEKLPLPKNYPTIDHIFSKKEGRLRMEKMIEGKKRQDGNGVYYVLSCNRCNQKRNDNEQKNKK